MEGPVEHRGNILASTCPRKRLPVRWLWPLLLLPAACASPEYQPYHAGVLPLFSPISWGYTDVAVRPDYFEIGFTSRTNDNPTRARYFATLRAAEVALAHGKQWFEIIEARPGETPFTWAALANPSAPDNANLAAIDATHNMVDLDAVSRSLLVHLQDKPTPASLNAREILQQGKREGITFSQATEESLKASN